MQRVERRRGERCGVEGRFGGRRQTRLQFVSGSHRATGGCKDTLMEERRGLNGTGVLLLLAADWVILSLPEQETKPPAWPKEGTRHSLLQLRALISFGKGELKHQRRQHKQYCFLR